MQLSCVITERMSTLGCTLVQSSESRLDMPGRSWQGLRVMPSVFGRGGTRTRGDGSSHHPCNYFYLP